MYPSDFKVSDNFAVNAEPELLIPYIHISVIITIPFSVPNYVPASIQRFPLHLAFSYALPMSHANIYKSFKDASINVILTLALDIILEYVIDYGGAVV